MATPQTAPVLSYRPRAVLAMSAAAYDAALPEPQRTRLTALAELRAPRALEDLDDPAAAALLADAEVLVTGWGCPPITPAVLDRAPELRAIVHTAGTVKTFLDRAVFARGIRVSSAATANAIPVAEFTFAAIVLACKRAFRLSHLYTTRRQRPDLSRERWLGTRGAVVGVVGASRVGRRVIELLAGLDVTVLVFDPYLPAAEARALGVQLVELDALLARSQVVTLHAPVTPDTVRLIDARRLALLQDGAVLVNTARGALVDHDALTAEVAAGRIDAVLDVTDPEPPHPDSPLFRLPNVFLTPHLAGSLGGETARLGESALDELARYAAGEPFRHEIRSEEFDRLA